MNLQQVHNLWNLLSRVKIYSKISSKQVEADLDDMIENLRSVLEANNGFLIIDDSYGRLVKEKVEESEVPEEARPNTDENID